MSDIQGSYVTDLLPFILMMSFGMGLTFVPLTLTAVHHLRDEDTGIGSGVLNTMQQVGGALGLSLLATLATQTITDRSKELGQAMADPSRSAPGVHRGRDGRVPAGRRSDARARPS